MGDAYAFSDATIQNRHLHDILRFMVYSAEHDYANSPICNALFDAANSTLSLGDAQAVRRIANGYIATHQGQKAIDLLNAHEQHVISSRVRNHIIEVIATPCFMGIGWYFPKAATSFVVVVIALPRALNWV